MNNFIRLFYQIAGTKKGRVKHAELVRNMMVVAKKKLTELSDAFHIPFEFNIDLHQGDEIGFTALTHAAKQGNLALVQWLVEEQKVDVNYEERSLRALFVAAAAGHLEVVNYLVKQNAWMLSYDIPAIANFHRRNASYSDQKNNIEIVKIFLEKFPESIQNNYQARAFKESKVQALVEAIKQNNCELVALLLNYVEKEDLQKYRLPTIRDNILHLAIDNNAHPYIIACVYAVCPTLAYQNLDSPLWLAIEKRNLPAVFLLTNSFSIKLNGKTYGNNETDCEKQFFNSLLPDTLREIFSSKDITMNEDRIFYLLTKANASMLKTDEDNHDERQNQIRSSIRGGILNMLISILKRNNHNAKAKPFLLQILFWYITCRNFPFGRKGFIIDTFATGKLENMWGHPNDFVRASGLAHVESLDRSEYLLKTGFAGFIEFEPEMGPQLKDWHDSEIQKTVVRSDRDDSEYPGLIINNNELADHYLSFYKREPVEIEKKESENPFRDSIMAVLTTLDANERENLYAKTSIKASNCFIQFLITALATLDEVSFKKLFIAVQEFLSNDDLFLQFAHLTTHYNLDLENEWYFDIDSVGLDGNNLLSKAIREKKTSIVTFLLEKGANSNYKYQNDETPVLIAAAIGNSDILSILKKYKANVHAVNSKQQNAAIVATINSNLLLLDDLKKWNVSLSTTDTDGKNALTYAIHADNVEAVEKLYKLGVAFESKRWQTVTECDSINVFNYLCPIQTKSDLNLLAYWSIKNSACKIFDAFKEHIDFTIQDEFGNSLLQTAVESPYEIFQVCLNKNISFTNKNNFGETVCDQLVAKLYDCWYEARKKRNLSTEGIEDNSLSLINGWFEDFKSSKVNLQYTNFANYLNKVMDLLLKENDSNRLVYSKEPEDHFSGFRKCIAAYLMYQLESCGNDNTLAAETKKLTLQNSIANALNNFSLRKILDSRAFLPEPFKSETFKAMQEFLIKQLGDNSKDDSDSDDFKSHQKYMKRRVGKF